MKKLPLKHVALSLGLFGAVSMLLMSLLANNGIGTPLVDLIGSVYQGYDLTGTGMVLGMIYGFFDGLIGGTIFVYIYNWVGTKI